MHPHFAIAEYQRRSGEFKGIEAEKNAFQQFAAGADAGEIDIRSQVNLTYSLYIVAGDGAAAIGPGIAEAAQHAAGAIAYGNVEPRRQVALFEKRFQVGAEPVGLSVVIFEHAFGQAAAKQIVGPLLQHAL